MKKKSLTLLLATTVASSILFSSCIGSFGLTNKLLTWNRSIDSKFVNELVFIAFWIVPVYEISALADVLVINSIEFWSGSNPVADVGNVKTIDGKDGVYTVETKVDGYHIQKEGVRWKASPIALVLAAQAVTTLETFPFAPRSIATLPGARLINAIGIK